MQPQTHAGKSKAGMENQAERLTFGRISLNSLPKYNESTPKKSHTRLAHVKVKGSSTQ